MRLARHVCFASVQFDELPVGCARRPADRRPARLGRPQIQQRVRRRDQFLVFTPVPVRVSAGKPHTQARGREHLRENILALPHLEQPGQLVVRDDERHRRIAGLAEHAVGPADLLGVAGQRCARVIAQHDASNLPDPHFADYAGRHVPHVFRRPIVIAAGDDRRRLQPVEKLRYLLPRLAPVRAEGIHQVARQHDGRRTQEIHLLDQPPIQLRHAQLARVHVGEMNQPHRSVLRADAHTARGHQRYLARKLDVEVVQSGGEVRRQRDRNPAGRPLRFVRLAQVELHPQRQTASPDQRSFCALQRFSQPAHNGQDTTG